MDLGDNNWLYSVMVSTSDSDSGNPSSIPGTTCSTFALLFFPLSFFFFASFLCLSRYSPYVSFSSFELLLFRFQLRTYSLSPFEETLFVHLACRGCWCLILARGLC
jgi:hypothetical protein